MTTPTLSALISDQAQRIERSREVFADPPAYDLTTMADRISRLE